MPRSNQNQVSSPNEDESTCIVWKGSASNRTKAQQEFNDALNKHRDTQNRVREVESLISLVNQKYVNEVIPEMEKQKALGKKRFSLMCEILIEEKISLGKSQREFIRRFLLESCVEALNEDYDFYQNYIEILETKSERMERLSRKKRTEAQLRKQFGVDVDLDDLNRTDFEDDEERQAHEEKYKDFREKFEEFRSKFYENAYGDHERAKKKKSKSQMDKERKIIDAEKLLSLDINALFKNLAKLIHPDKEQDPILRAKKSQLMTSLSGARDNMNIAEILEIKMQVDELIPNHQTEVSFNDSSIKRFISIIKAKIRDLEQTIASRLFSHPLLEDYQGKNVNPDHIKKYIDKIVKENQFLSNAFEQEVEKLSKHPKYLKDMIRDFQSI
jgi:hypothetical protein